MTGMALYKDNRIEWSPTDISACNHMSDKQNWSATKQESDLLSTFWRLSDEFHLIQAQLKSKNFESISIAIIWKVCEIWIFF